MRVKNINTEIIKAIAELQQAEQNFKYAYSEFVDIAVLQLNASKMKVNALVNLKIKWTHCNGSMSKI